jgi:hypothetical protein
MSDQALTPERSARLLRAKAGELEHKVKVHASHGGVNEHFALVADVALIAGLLADHIERGLSDE